MSAKSSLRLFFALWPDDATRAGLAAWGAAMHAACGGRRIPAEKLHVTLAFLGATPPERFDGLAAAASRVEVPCFELVLEQPGYWKQNRIAWAGAQTIPLALGALVDKLRLELAAGGVAFDVKPFVPHVTLVRDGKRPGEVPELAPVRWPVSSFALVESRGGAYQPLNRWSLR